MLYEKFLELYEYNDSELRKLETNFKSRLNKSLDFYPINNSFYIHCKLFYSQNAKLRQFHENAPNRNYKIFDFVSIKGYNVKINLQNELFTLYAVNQNQIAAVENVNNFVATARKI